MLSAYGVGKTDALAYGIILQAVEIATAVAMGMPALVREGMTWKDLRLRALHASPVQLRGSPPRRDGRVRGVARLPGAPGRDPACDAHSSSLLVAALLLAIPLTAGAAKRAAKQRTYVVLYERGASTADARAAIKAAGGRLVEQNAKVGVATVRSANADFVADVSRTRAVVGAARNRLGRRGAGWPHQVRDPFAIERMTAQRQKAAGDGAVSRAARRPAGGALRRPPVGHAHDQRDAEQVLQAPARQLTACAWAIIDTGIDGSHPDIAPNFNRSLSRNFTTDIPLIDGPCEEEADQSCNDANNVDEDGHGTHVAGTVGAPINRLGMAGVAPDVELVNIRAGQDSGYFFLQASVDALTYAADVGIDVVNMSYYIDPWLYNCADNPADSPEEQLEQQTVIRRRPSGPSRTPAPAA